MFNPRIRIWRPHHASSEEASKFSELSADTRDLMLLMHQKRALCKRFLGSDAWARLQRRRSTLARFKQKWDGGLSSIERKINSVGKMKFLKFRPDGFCSEIKEATSELKDFDENQKLQELDARVEAKKYQSVMLCRPQAKQQTEDTTQTDTAHKDKDEDVNKKIVEQLILSFATRCKNNADSNKLRRYQDLAAKDNISMQEIEAVAKINTHRHTSGCLGFASVFFRWRKTTSMRDLQDLRAEYESSLPSI